MTRNPLTNLVEQLQNGKKTSVQLIEACAEKIALADDKTIFTCTTFELALKDAQRSDQRRARGETISSLDGIPVAFKDNIDIAGMLTSNGLDQVVPKVARQNAWIYDHITSMGAICIGKTTMNEIAYSGLGVNSQLGTPRNVFSQDQHLIPGGSSSGSAVAVSFGLVPLAIGTDTGGSVRIPAAWNGIVGLKTTHGLFSTAGVTPLSQSMDTIGFLTQSVADLSLVYHCLRPQQFSKTQKHSGRIGLVQNRVLENMPDSVAQVYHKALEKLQIAMTTIDVPVVDELFDTSPGIGNIISFEAYQNWAPLLKANPEAISKEIVSRISLGKNIDNDTYRAIKEKQKLLSQQYVETTIDYDVVAMPTVVIPPPSLKWIMERPENFHSANSLALRNTRIANLLGLCSISIPIGYTKEHLPVGLMLLAHPYQEEKLLKVAQQIENQIDLR